MTIALRRKYYNKKKKQKDRDQAKFDAQFEADRHALDFHNA